MVDIPSTNPVTPPPAQTATQVTPVTLPIETTVSNVPDKIQELIRQIQVNATITSMPDSGTITLNSILGPLTILLPQIADAQQQKLTQQMLSLLQSQKPVTVIVQPGSPPTQAFLFLPPTPNTTQTNNAVTPPNPAVDLNQLLQQPTNLPRAPLTVNTILPAIVLPPDIAFAPVARPGDALTPNPIIPATNNAAPAATAVGTTPAPTSGVPSLLPLAPEIPENLLLQAITLLANNKVEQIVTQSQQQFLANTPLPPVIPPQTAAPSSTSPQAPTVSAPLAPPTNLTPAQILLQQPGNNIVLRVDAVIPPTAPTATAVSSLAPLPALNLPTPGPNQVIATVVGNGTNGQLVLKAGNATLYVNQNNDAPVGTNLLVTVQQAKPTILAPLGPSDAQIYPSLPQTLVSLLQFNPQVAAQVMENRIPQPTTALPGALLFFMNAFKQGNVRGWLGDEAVDVMSRLGKMELVAKLTQELNGAGETVRDNVVGEWRSYPIPLNANNQFHVLNFYVHDGSQRQAEKDAVGKVKSGHTRFLIDVNLSKLGAMQMDGFIQPRKLDMIIRSEHALPEGLHQELRGIYTKTLGAIDYAGSLNFQVGRHHWLVIQRAAAAKATITT